MRILVLNYEFPPLGGGASPASYEIARGYVKLGHKVDVVTMGYKGLPDHQILDGMNIYRVPCLRSKKELCYTHEMASYILNAILFLRKHLKKNKYDLNHSHFIIPTGIISLWAKKKFGLNYIITSHGSDILGYNDDRFKFLHKFTRPILRKIISSANKITTPSNYLKELIEKNVLNKKSEKIITIPYSSDNYFKTGYKKENIIISSGRLLPRKGFQYLIKAFKELKRNDWKLYIIGDGPYKNQLLKIANKNTIFTGWLDNKSEKYIGLFNKAKIFSLLSKKETLGVVFTEAMSTGCAILSSNISACKETVTNDVGFLVNPKNINEVKNKLSILMNNDKLRKTLSQNSRNRYKKYYDWKKVILRYNKLLKQVII